MTGGAGADVFEFIARVHATIADFQLGVDSIVLRGVAASGVQVTSAGGNMLVDIGGGANVTLTGVSAPASALGIIYET